MIPEITGSLLLIGNGPSAAKGELGKEIDEFDDIIRFNLYQVEGYEDSVGSRTTFWATTGRDQYPRKADPPEKILLTHGGAKVKTGPGEHIIYRVPYAFHQEKRKLVQGIGEMHGHEKSKGLLPSSGLLAITWLLDVAKVKKLTLHGFDFFSKKESGQHHYWVKGSFIPPVEHYGAAEALILKTYGDKINFLTKQSELQLSPKDSDWVKQNNNA
tara:strand:- start:3353 stop:3994 length:642 start_codon:yes stop_codon:yes gene_type:complete